MKANGKAELFDMHFIVMPFAFVEYPHLLLIQTRLYGECYRKNRIFCNLVPDCRKGLGWDVEKRGKGLVTFCPSPLCSYSASISSIMFSMSTKS